MLVTEDMHHRVGWSAYSIGLKAGAAARALSTEGRAALRNFCEHVVRRVLRRRSSFLSLSLSPLLALCPRDISVYHHPFRWPR